MQRRSIFLAFPSDAHAAKSDLISNSFSPDVNVGEPVQPGRLVDDSRAGGKRLKGDDVIATTSENVEAARSQLLDLDIASEMSKFVSRQILLQSGASMLAQANKLPSNLLQLLR